MSATVEFFEQDFIVGQYECDCNGRMKAGALMPRARQSAPTTATNWG